jgi:ceroid-lipofuscinosis MFS transporter 7
MLDMSSTFVQNAFTMATPSYNVSLDLLSSASHQEIHSHQQSDAPYVAMEMAGPRPKSNQNEKIFSDVPPVIDKDETDDGDSVAVSIVSSVMTAEGIHDWTGFCCVCLVVLIGDMSRGVMFPSMWPLVESLGGSQITLGYAVAAFSFGRVLVNPVFGSWSHQIGYTKTLLMSCSILFVGTLCYAQTQNVGRPEFLIVSQTILGVGSGTLGVTRAFVADVTAKRQRTTYMAWITAVQYAGFTVTPFFGALFNFAFQNNDYQYGIFRLNMFTAPAYFMACFVVGTFFVLIFFFQDRHRIYIRKEAKKSKKRAAMEDIANAVTWIGISVYDCCILGCMLLNVSTKGSISSFETLGISIAQSHFDMVASRAGMIVATCGTMGVCALLSMGTLSNHFNDVQLISGGMTIMAIGIASLTTIEEGIRNPSWRYFVAMFLIYSIGFPIGHTAVIGLFSKGTCCIFPRERWNCSQELITTFVWINFAVVGRRPQGALLGWFASAGSLARMFFPIMSGYVADYKDVETLFCILTGVLFVSIAFVYWSRDILLFLSS